MVKYGTIWLVLSPYENKRGNSYTYYWGITLWTIGPLEPFKGGPPLVDHENWSLKITWGLRKLTELYWKTVQRNYVGLLATSAFHYGTINELNMWGFFEDCCVSKIYTLLLGSRKEPYVRFYHSCDFEESEHAIFIL